MRFIKIQDGYTLIELLVVVVLMTMMIVTVTNLLFALLRGGNQAQVSAKLRDQGDPAIVAIERLLRQAKKFEDCGGSQIKISIEDDLVYQYLLEGDQIIRRQLNQNGEIVNEYKLTDGEVKVKNLDFSCELGSGMTPSTVSVSFGVEDVTGQVEEVFQTKITMRNTGR